MAIAYLQSISSFAAAGWSDATGFAAAADLVINIQGLNVQAALDQSGVTLGIDSLDIEATATGKIGGAGGSLITEANTGLARVTNNGAVALYLAAVGASGTPAHITSFGCSNGENYLTGGEFTNVTVAGGVCNVKAATTVTNMYITGGSGTIEHNATAITNLVILGGSWVVERGATTVFIGPNANVTWDGDKNGNGKTLATVNLFGRGRLATKSGAITTLNKYGGTIDTTPTERALTISTLNNYPGLAEKVSTLVTITTETFFGAASKVVTPIPGAPPNL